MSFPLFDGNVIHLCYKGRKDFGGLCVLNGYTFRAIQGLVKRLCRQTLFKTVTDVCIVWGGKKKQASKWTRSAERMSPENHSFAFPRAWQGRTRGDMGQTKTRRFPHSIP